MARYDENGNQRWLHQFGTSQEDRITALIPDIAGGVMVAGSTNGGLGGPNAGSEDAFLARYATGICYADCNQHNIINTLDFLCYLNQYNKSDPAADCNGDGIVNTLDFLCFLNAFNDGC